MEVVAYVQREKEGRVGLEMKVVHIKGPWNRKSRYFCGKIDFRLNNCLTRLGKFNIDANCTRRFAYAKVSEGRLDYVH